MTDLASGWPLLVDGGKACTRCCSEPLCADEAARAAVAIARGRTIFVAVAAPGVSLPKLAALLAQLGAERALNLDGGGSASLVLDGRAVVGATLKVPVHIGALPR